MLPRSYNLCFAALLIAVPLLSALPAIGQMSDIPSARKPVVTPKPISFGAPMEVMNSPDFAIFELDLSRLLGSSDPINLTGTTDSLTIALPVPGLWRPENVNFLLNIKPSAALAKGSNLQVFVNGSVVLQHPLHPDKDTEELDISLPVKLLNSGANQVKVQVTQRETAPVDEATSSQLWSQVNVAASRFTISASRKLLVPHLSNLDDLFDRAGWSGKTQIPVFSAENSAAKRLQALGLIAQGVGQRQGTVPVAISHQTLPTDMERLVTAMPESSTVALVLGSFEEIAALNPELIFPQDSGPVIALARLPGEIARYGVFLVAGNDGDLLRAATAFATLGVPWPQREWVAITNAELVAPSSLPNSAEANGEQGRFPLRAWGYTTTAFNNLEQDGVKFSIWQNDATTPVKLLLNLSYTRGLSADSSLAVLVNSQIEAQLALDKPEGSTRAVQELTIAAEALHPGWNSLELKPFLHTQHGEENRSEDLSLILHDNSTIEIADQPAATSTDLAWISGQGPLFSRAPLGGDLAFNLAAGDSDTVSAGLTLMAKISQLHRGPLLESRFGIGPFAGATRHFWVGSWDKLPEDVKPEHFTSTSVAFAVPVGESSASLDLTLTAGFDNKSVAFTTDGDSEQTVVFAAPNAGQLRDGLASLVDRELWGQLDGRAIYWSPNNPQVDVIGKKTAPPRATASAAPKPQSWVKILLPLLGLAALAIILSTLRSRRKFRTGSSER